MQPGVKGQVGSLSLPHAETLRWVAKRQKLPEGNSDLSWDSSIWILVPSPGRKQETVKQKPAEVFKGIIL